MSITDQNLARTLTRLADAIEGKPKGSQVRYIFDPKDDMTLQEVIALLKSVGISADSDQLLSEHFPEALRRHFRAQS